MSKMPRYGRILTDIAFFAYCLGNEPVRCIQFEKTINVLEKVVWILNELVKKNDMELLGKELFPGSQVVQIVRVSGATFSIEIVFDLLVFGCSQTLPPPVLKMHGRL